MVLGTSMTLGAEPPKEWFEAVAENEYLAEKLRVYFKAARSSSNGPTGGVPS